MFRTLSKNIQIQRGGQPGDVFVLHPRELFDYLEAVWALRKTTPPIQPTVGQPRPEAFLSSPNFPRVVPADAEWRHLIYAFMIENTRTLEIFRRVLAEYRHGEKLGIAPEAVQYWLRNTEALLFRAPPFDSILRLSSEIRPDSGAIRRNAYYRMFGMELNHGTAENKPYSYVKPAASNSDFADTLEDLLRETWVAIRNSGNSSGANPTDQGSLQSHGSRLKTMLTDRRQRGNLSREEFVAVASMSWLHLTLEIDSPVVVALEANASSSFERLKKIGDRVGFPAHAKGDDYFRLAEPIAELLRFIEAADWTQPSTAEALFVQGANPIRGHVNTVITHWGGATGKSLKVTPTPKAA